MEKRNREIIDFLSKADSTLIAQEIKAEPRDFFIRYASSTPYLHGADRDSLTLTGIDSDGYYQQHLFKVEKSYEVSGKFNIISLIF